MKTIQKDELFQNLKGFLKAKGIGLQEGSYTRRIEQSCGVLAESINLSQRALHRAKEGMGKSLERVRQVIHEKTAPKPPPAQSPPVAPAVSEPLERKVEAKGTVRKGKRHGASRKKK